MLSEQELVPLHEKFSEEYRGYSEYSQIFDLENIENALFTLKELVTQNVDSIIENVPLDQTGGHLVKMLTSLDVIKDDKVIHYKVREVASDYIKIIEKYGHGYICQWDNVPLHHINKKTSRRYIERDTLRRDKVLSEMKREIRGSGDYIHSPKPA